MPTAALGPLVVSRLGSGAGQMGGRIPRGKAYRMLDRFLEAVRCNRMQLKGMACLK